MKADAAHNIVVLAAGGSTRLGRSKQLLTRNGEALVARSVRLAQETLPHRLLLIVGAQADEVIAAAHDPHVEVLINPHWREGLASSLRYAACALAQESAPTVILGCDQPALEVEHLRMLIAGFQRSGCAVTRYAQVRGLPAMVPAELLARALSLQGDVGLRAVLRERGEDAVFQMEAPELGLDVDTAEDLAQARARGWVDT